MCDEKTQALADRLEILDLIARWAYTTDTKDPDGFAEIYAEDGVLDTVSGVTESREAIRKLVTESMQKRTIQTRHFQTGTVFLELTSTTARTSTSLLFTKRELGAVAVSVGTGRYLDEWRRTGSGWSMVRRTTTVDP